MTYRPSTAAPILAVLTIVLVTPGTYVAGYFCFGEYSRTFDMESGETVCASRSYRHGLLTVAFRPDAVAESWVRRVDVSVTVQRPRIPLKLLRRRPISSTSTDATCWEKPT
jgi:hypothetical protein